MKIIAHCRKHPEAQVLMLEATVRATLSGCTVEDLNLHYMDAVELDIMNTYCTHKTANVAADEHDIRFAVTADADEIEDQS